MLALLYHRAGVGKYANSPAFLEKHLSWIKENFRTVLPGDCLQKQDVCLTFDDATYDFYYYVFPLLQRLQLKAVLAVPAGFIQKTSSLHPKSRAEADQGDMFCTWEELREIKRSNLVEIASHSMSHPNLLLSNDLVREVETSKSLLEEKLNTSVRTFVYPLGKFNRPLHTYVKKHYEFVMRIGSACNYGWQNHSGLIYRIPCDQLSSIEEPFRMHRLLSYNWSYLINSLRRR